jgi:hypothetical protein
MSAKQSRFPSGITAFLGHKVRIQPTGQVLPTLMLLGRMYGSGMPMLVIALGAGILDLIGRERIAPCANPHIPVDMFHAGEPAMVIRDFTFIPGDTPIRHRRRLRKSVVRGETAAEDAAQHDPLIHQVAEEGAWGQRRR